MDIYYMLLPYLPDYMSESFKRQTLAAANGEHTAQFTADFQAVIIHIKELLDPQGRKLIYSTKDKKWIWKRSNKVSTYFRKWLSKLKQATNPFEVPSHPLQSISSTWLLIQSTAFSLIFSGCPLPAFKLNANYFNSGAC